MSEHLLQALTVTAELTGTKLSRAAMAVMVEDLIGYGEEPVLAALERCRRELTGRLSLAAIIDRMHGDDGRPGADEAWAIAIGARDESQTVVWTTEIREAFHEVAEPLLDLGDETAARMAFRDRYSRMLREARQSRAAVQWVPSIGWDTAKREAALTQAARRGLLAAPLVSQLLPAPSDMGAIGAALLGGPVDASLDETVRQRIAGVRSHLEVLNRRATGGCE